MEYSQVMLEMLERIKVLENKVKVLEEKIENTPTPKPQTAMQLDKVSAKYRGLAEYLGYKTRVDIDSDTVTFIKNLI